jgi:hypothetical protein
MGGGGSHRFNSHVCTTSHIIITWSTGSQGSAVLGFMAKENKNINGLTGAESNPYNTSDPNGRRLNVTENAHDVDPGVFESADLFLR